jgi:hypothetical protein
LFKGVKKTVSSIGKGVSSALKGVGKALKRVAPIVVPLALNYFLPGLGAVYSGALGAGLTSLMQGAKLEDAFKSALIGGATGAVTAGFSGPNKGLDGFGQNIAADVSTGTQNISQAFTQGSFDPLTSTSLPSLQDLASEDTAVKSDTTLYDGTKAESIIPEGRNLSAKSTPGDIPRVSGDPYLQKGTTALGGDIYPDLAASQKATEAGIMQGYGFPDAQGNFAGQNMDLRVGQESPSFTQQLRAGDPTFGFEATNLSSKPPTTFEQIKDFGSKASDIMFGQSSSQSDILARAGEIQTEAAAKNLTLTGKQAIAMAEKELAPSFLRKYGPSTALGIAGLTGAGAFDVPEQEELTLGQTETGRDVYMRDPNKYMVGDTGIRKASFPNQAGTSYGFEYNPYLYSRTPFQTVADGGEIFPRRNGGIGPREGTPGKDSVRAMLMPGEFVMTTDAVKGLGGGNLDNGIKNMYNVMSKLEKRGKAMA